MNVLPLQTLNHVEHPMLVDVQYARTRRNEVGELLPDTIYMIWKDLDTNEKHLSYIENPAMEVFFEKPETRDFTRHKPWEYKTRLNSKIVKCKDVIRSIAEDGGDSLKNQLMDIYNTKNFKAMDDMFRYVYSFGADYDPKFFYRYLWLKSKNNDMQKHLTKGSMDIEVDLVNTNNRFPEAQLHAIELVTLIDHDARTSYTFILKQPPYVSRNVKGMGQAAIHREVERRKDYLEKVKQQEELLKDLPGLEKELHEEFDEIYGVMDYKFYVYAREDNMIVDIFRLVNTLRLDFIEFWNISFDVPYIYDRAVALGIDPVQLFTHPDFPNPYARFVKDRRKNSSSIKDNGDHFECSNYTNFVCQMRIYAQVRKGESELRSYRLNDIGKIEIADSKLNYAEEGNLKKFACHNYRRYVIYNIKDVLLQYGIEKKTEDLDTYYNLSYLNCTPYPDVFKQTAVLRNIQYIYYDKQGVIPGNNVNRLDYYMKMNKRQMLAELGEDVDDDEKAEGAVVGNPLLNGNFGVELYGNPSSHIFRYSVDMDMSAFYPHIIVLTNIEETCLIFRVNCPVTIFDIRGGENPWRGITDKFIAPPVNGKIEKFYEEDAAKEIFDNYQTGNILSTGYKFLNMPGVDELYAELQQVMR